MSNKGFTTIEIAIVLIISGVLLAMFLRGYSYFIYDKNYKVTEEHMTLIDNALNEYMQEFGRYPCPADPTLDPSHIDYGRETICGARELSAFAEDCSTGHRPIYDQTLFDTGVRTESNVICARGTNVTRDVDGDGDDEYVLIGILPFRTFSDLSTTDGFLDEYREYITFDGYDMRFTYAVTETMADRDRDSDSGTGVTPNLGAIRIVDENNIDLTVPARSAHYVLISHGANRRGAYNAEGNLVGDTCFIGTGPANVGVDDPYDTGTSYFGDIDLDTENCDHLVVTDPDNSDAVFRKAIRSNAEGDPSYFDDVVHYRSSFSTNLWASARNTTGLPGQKFLYNTNIGNVGVGEDFVNPSSKLHVLGDVVIIDDNPGSGSVPTILSEEGYCGDFKRPIMTSTASTPVTDLSICFQPEQIVDTGSSCPDGEVAVGMNRGQVLCEPLFLPSPTFNTAGACGLDSTDLDGDGNTIEQTYVNSIRYNRGTNEFTVTSCAPL